MAQMNQIANQAQAVGDKAFRNVGETISNAVSKPMKETQESIREAITKPAKDAETELESICKRAAEKYNKIYEPQKNGGDTTRTIEDKPSRLASQMVEPPAQPEKQAEKLPPLFRAASDAAGLLNQKMDNTNAQIGVQQEKLRELNTQYAALLNSKGDGTELRDLEIQMTAVEGKLISLHGTATQTEDKLKQMANAPVLAAQKAQEKLRAAQEKTAAQAAAVAEKAKAAQVRAAQQAAAVSQRMQAQAQQASQRKFKESTKGFQRMGKTIQGAFKATFLTAGLYAAFRGIKKLIEGAVAQNKEFSNSLATVKTNLAAAFQPIMQAVMPALTTMMNGLANLSKQIAAFIAGLFGQTYSQAIAAQKKLEGTQSKAQKASQTSGLDEINVLDQGEDAPGAAADTAVNGSTDAAESFGEKVRNVFQEIGQNVSDFWSGFTQKLSPSVTAWGTAFDRLKEPATSAFAQVQASSQRLWSETLLPFAGYVTGNFVPAIANSFSKTFAPIFSDVLAAQLKEFPKDFEFMCRQIDRGVKDIITPAMDHMKHVITDAFGGIKSAWDEFGGSIIEKWHGFKESLRQIWDNLYTNIFKPIWDNFMGAISELWDEHLKPLWDNITSFFGAFAEMCLAVWNNVLAPWVNWFIETVGPTITHVFNGIVNVIMTVFGIIADLVGGLIRMFKGIIEFITGVFTGDWEKAWTGIKDFFGGIWDQAYAIFRGVVNLIIDGINILWSAVYDVVRGIVDSIGGIAGAIGDIFGQEWHFSMPKDPPLIPHLANGGVATQPTLAMIGEYPGAKSNPEIVAPEDKLRQIMGESGGNQEMLAVMREQNELLRAILDKDDGVVIGDETIYRAGKRAESRAGIQVSKNSAFAFSY